MYDIIEKKRDGYPLSEREIKFFIDGYTNGKIPDYQVSALLMAIYFQGMSDEESAHLTLAMAKSGTMLDLSEIKGIKVDKHSTGGVGDKTTLCLIPLVASVGVPIPKMSGRGLGHTGGTIDKLESIEGFHIELSEADFIQQVNEYGLAIIGQTENLAPADKLLYSLRDVTATVNSIPLIASSIMSKKIASGADAIVLDVKTGDGAFMKSVDDAKALAKAMVSIGHGVGRKTTAIISNMDQPLGFAIGNALEVREAIDTLKGKGPKDLTELCLTLGSQMIVLAKRAKSVDEAYQMLTVQLESGQALKTFKQFIRAQGGDPTVADDPDLLPKADYQIDVTSQKDGYVTNIVAQALGEAALALGAGRDTKDSVIDLSVGIVLHKKIGDSVKKGDVLATIHANDASVERIKKQILTHIHIKKEKPAELPLIYDVMTL